MDIRRNPEPGRQAVLWLATAIVILIGAAGCAFIILAAVEQPSQNLLVLAAVFGGLIVFLGLMAIPGGSHRSNRWMFFWLTRNRTNPRNVLRIGRKRNTSKTEFGTNSPPTLESIREASEQNVSWVPHGPPPDRPRPR